MTWELQFAEPAARAALYESMKWRKSHPSTPTLFDDDYDRALELISLQPLGYRLILSARFKNARRFVMQATGFIVFYRVDQRRGIIRVLDVVPGPAQKEQL
jgi:hypothetical protein